MKVTKQETLYYKDHGATLKHKCGKRIVTLSLLSFSLIFLGPSLFYGLFFIPRLGQCSNNDDHHTSFFLTTQYLEQNMTLYECLRRCTSMCNDS